MGALRVAAGVDSVLLREGLVRVLAEAGVDVVGSYGDGDQLLEALPSVNPALAVLDVRMPPTFRDESVRAAIRARELKPGLGILLLSQYVEVAYARELLSDGSGGIGYLLKDRVASLDELQSAIQRIASGGTVLDPEVVSQLLGRHQTVGEVDTTGRGGAHAHGGGAHECSDRRGLVHRDGRRREERDGDLPKTRAR